MSRRPYRDHLSAAVTILSDRGGKRSHVVNSYVFRFIGRFARTIETEHEGIRYFLDTSDIGVSLPIFLDGGFEAPMMDQVLKLVEDETGRSIANSTFLDIGANIGSTTALAIKKYGAARVVAFEPEPRNHELLQLLIVANGLQSQVEAHRVALSRTEGVALLELSEMNTGDHRVRVGSKAAGALGEQRRRTTSVPMARLDMFDVDLDEVSLAWMDVQGHEGHVLAGASRLLAADVPVITEYHPYMLGRADGLDLFHSIVEESFTTVVDLRDASKIPAAEVCELAHRYPSPGPGTLLSRNSYTDLLLLH